MSRFELTVTVQDVEQIQARTQGDAVISGKVKQEPLLLDTIRIFDDWLSQGNITRRQEFEVLGRLLYEVLFSGEIGAFFERLLSEARKTHERLVVRLSFTEAAAKLANLPWEYLYYEKERFFLSTRVDLVLSRYVQLGVGDQSIEPEEGPLRILIVVSNLEDQDLASVSANEVVKVIEELASDYRIEFARLDKPTIDNFLNKLEETKPHVLHFIGYGRYNKAEGEAKIAMLEDNETSSRWVNDDDFAEYFTRATVIPRLVLLHLCASAANGSATNINYDNFTANFAQLAPQLLRVNIPVVVAMQHPITDQAARAFCKTFYRALAKGESIDAAVQEGRWNTTRVADGYNNRVFGTPVLYMRSHGGIIQRADEMSSTQEKQIAGEIARVPKTVSKMPSDISLDPPPRLTPTQEPLQSTASLSSKQDAVSFGEPRQAKSVSIEPKETDSNQVLRFNFVKDIFSAGKNKMAEMPNLTPEHKGQINQILSKIRDQLFMEANADDMKKVLHGYLKSEDSDFRVIITSMIDALE
jgi:hypothetical protein